MGRETRPWLLVLDRNQEPPRELVFAMTVGSGGSEDTLAGQRVPVGEGLTGLAALTHEVQIGVPTIQGAVRMPKRVGWQNAMELLLLGDRVSAERAKEMGLVWKVVGHDDLMTEARTLADRLCKPAPLAIRATKEVAHRGQQLSFVGAIRFGETMRRVAGSTDDAKMGPEAYREKRQADWQAH